MVVLCRRKPRQAISSEAKKEEGQIRIVCCTIGRTARKIMDGRVYIPRSAYAQSK